MRWGLRRVACVKQHEMLLEAEDEGHLKLGRGGGRRALAVAMATLLGVSACGGGSDAKPSGATMPKATTTTTIDISVVPDEITVAYAQAVMDELDRVLGEAIRELVAKGEPTDEFVALLRAVYAEPQFSKEESYYGEDAANQFEGYRRPPGSPKTTVKSIIDSSSDCLVLDGQRSFAEVFTTERRSYSSLLQLQLASGQAKAQFPWRLVADITADSLQNPTPEVCG